MSRIITHLVTGLTLLIMGAADAQTQTPIAVHQTASNDAKNSLVHGALMTNSSGIQAPMRKLEKSRDIHSNFFV